MIRTYRIQNKVFVPVSFNDTAKTIYVSSELLMALHQASPKQLYEAEQTFSRVLGTSSFQIVCLEKDQTSQFISDFTLSDSRVEVPVAKVFKVGD